MSISAGKSYDEMSTRTYLVDLMLSSNIALNWSYIPQFATRPRKWRTKADYRGSVIARREQGVLAASGKWPSSESFASSWLEDDARIEEVLRKRLGGPERWLAHLPQAASAIMDGILEKKRDVWTERLLWMALLSKACPDRPPLPWRAFLVIARDR